MIRVLKRLAWFGLFATLVAVLNVVTFYGLYLAICLVIS